MEAANVGSHLPDYTMSNYKIEICIQEDSLNQIHPVMSILMNNY